MIYLSYLLETQEPPWWHRQALLAGAPCHEVWAGGPASPPSPRAMTVLIPAGGCGKCQGGGDGDGRLDKMVLTFFTQRKPALQRSKCVGGGSWGGEHGGADQGRGSGGGGGEDGHWQAVCDGGKQQVCWMITTLIYRDKLMHVRNESLRLRMLEDHVTKHSLRSEPHSMCKVCTRILEGKWCCVPKNCLIGGVIYCTQMYIH